MITNVAACLLDIAFVIDHSGSIRDANKFNPPDVDNWQFIIDFMVAVVSSINISQSTTYVGAVSFGTPSSFTRLL